MKRYFFCLIFIVMFSVCMNLRQAEAYSVTVEEDSIYAEVVPPSIMKNVATMFQKQVRKAMKYYDKYKDADAYTYAQKVPDEYRDFIEVAKKIQDSDEIKICHPFFIYRVPADDIWYQYYFVAKKNQEKLCVFSIDIGTEQGKTQFTYDNMMDRYFSLDGNITEETLFYQVGDQAGGKVFYAETPEKVEVVREIPVGGIYLGDTSDEEGKEFYKKKYEEKKNDIFKYLNKIKGGKAVKKSDENIKIDLKEEYIEPDSTPEERHGSRVYIAVVFVILCILAACLVTKIRKKGWYPEELFIKYISKNIRSFAKDYTKIFVLLVITITASTLIIHFSYGLFRAYREKREVNLRSTNKVMLKLKGSYAQKGASQEEDMGGVVQMGDLMAHTYEKRGSGNDVTVSDMKEFVRGLDSEVADKLLNVHTGILIGDYRFETDFLVDSGTIVNSGDYGFESLYNFHFGTTTTNVFQSGRYFTDEEYKKGSKVCIMYGFNKEGRGDYMEKHLTDSSHVLLGEEEYRIIGLQNGIGTGYIPITSVAGDSILLDEIVFQFRDNISLREIGMLNKASERYFGNRVNSLFELEEDEDNSYLYNTVILLIILVSLVAAFNFCALYHYIVTTRERTLKIFRICGLSLWKSIWLYVGECSFLSIGTYLAALGIFHFVLMPSLAGAMDIFDFHYKAIVYVVLFLLYFASSFLIEFLMIAVTLKKKTIR